jgi:hypothetical protein
VDTLNKFLVFPWETFSSFFMQLSKRKMCLQIGPTSLTELGRSNVKKFHTNIYFLQDRGESSLHQPGYHSLASWFNITIEPNENCEYSWLVRSVSTLFVFKMIYVTLIISSNGPGDISYHPLLPGLFWRQTFWLGGHTKVVIHSITLSHPLSTLR